ncbi:malonate decarboxylase subunit alpha, partial [Enterobacter hormaechei]
MNPSWDTLERSRQARLERAAPWARGREVAATDVGELLHALLEPGDKVCLEGNNQKQADFLAQA